MLLQVGYCIFLERAYREGGLTQVYPIARGVAPLLVTLGAAVTTGERPTLAAMFALVMVSIGILTFAFERTRPGAKTVWAAIITGIFVAAFTVNDGVGARLSGHAQAYADWLFVLQGLVIPLAYLLMRGRLTIAGRGAEVLKAALAGTLSMLAYGTVLLALTLSPMGAVSALRESSILFAAIIGVVFLKETLSLRRFSTVVMIAIGALTLSLAPIGH